MCPVPHRTNVGINISLNLCFRVWKARGAISLRSSANDIVFEKCRATFVIETKDDKEITVSVEYRLRLLISPANLLDTWLFVKGIKNGCPCIVEIRGTQGCRRVQGRSQGTTLSASDLHNARATILNPFYNMEYKIIKKIRQNTAWMEADILAKNLTPNRCNALAPAIVYVSNDVTIPFNSVTSQ